MENITESFKEALLPHKGLVIYQGDTAGLYVESFDFSLAGNPINFHPLTELESKALGETLFPVSDSKGFLYIKGLIPSELLHINTSHQGCAVWQTGIRKIPLFFKDQLGIPSGLAYVPPLLWKATKKTLYVFALPDKKRPGLQTQLYRAPFFNIHDDGEVCMGDVTVNIADDCALDSFIAQWERYFFTSYFSHLIGSKCPVTGNIVQLWKGLVQTGNRFPVERLIQSSRTLKSLLT